MRGTVKFYNREKGYGFIFVNGSKDDFYFNIKEWKDNSIPNANDDVVFDMEIGSKGKKAVNIRLLKSAADKKNSNGKRNFNDDRITCPSCGRKIVPRMITYRGEPEKSVCPFCGETVKEFSKCFIATAVYKDTYHPNVVLLRDFRNKYLLTNDFGTKFVDIYYKISPPVADFIRDRKYLSFPIKIILDGLVFVYKKMNYPGENTSRS